MKTLKKFITESSKLDHKLAKKAFDKFPSSQKRMIKKLKNEFDNLAYDDSPETLMSQQYGTLSPLDRNVIDKAQIISNEVFRKDKNLIDMLNPTGKYRSSPSEDNFIMNLWDLFN